MTAAISLENLSKRYWRLSNTRSLVGAVTSLGRDPRAEMWALRDLNLEIEQGDTLGIIGRNGSGKTTLLRILAGVTQPTSGRAVVVGRVAPLIGLGVGFRKELSGRENIVLNGMMLGMSRKLIQQRLDEIIEFSELGNFIETPVKFYSSGMYLRLAFAVAIHSDAEVLLIDEILAVGDLAFQSKCMARIREVQDTGATIVLVSHSISAIMLMSSKAMLMRRGQIEVIGDPATAVGRYHELLSVDATTDPHEAMDNREHMYLGGVTIIDKKLVGADGRGGIAYRDRPLRFDVRVRFDQPADDPQFVSQVRASDGTVVYSKQSKLSAEPRSYKEGDTALLSISFEPRLTGGTYRISGHVANADGRGVLARDATGLYFFVEDRAGERGLVDLEGKVSVDGVEIEARPSLFTARKT